MKPRKLRTFNQVLDALAGVHLPFELNNESGFLRVVDIQTDGGGPTCTCPLQAIAEVYDYRIEPEHRIHWDAVCANDNLTCHVYKLADDPTYRLAHPTDAIRLLAACGL
jgi:hypothetical protein